MINLDVGDIVDVTDPLHKDSAHENAFSGIIEKIDHEKGLIFVRDSDDNVYPCEIDEIEDNEYSLTPMS